MILGDSEYEVHFSYGFNKKGQEVTSCVIHRTPCLMKDGACEALPFGEGYARRNLSDQYRKYVGRKLALARSMLSLGIPRQTRARLWPDYFRQVRDL